MVGKDRNAGRRAAQRSLWLLLAAMVAVTVFPTGTHAQIVGDLEANIPFAFHAGNAKLPAGTYRIHVLDTTDLSVMEITSADGSVSALFEVDSAQANAIPTKSELIFNKYGDHYFLSQLFDQGSADGSQVPKSRYEKRVIASQAAQGKLAQQHVPAHRVAS